MLVGRERWNRVMLSEIRTHTEGINVTEETA